ncbi:MAG TPA: 50S ribosomal protein L20 [Candidatus Paceibacterota bacterium]|jgi:large subunit ribosomal protein L20|nr:50S ribosomal protein L20 [Candidatus Paceibacterota bacterium]HRS47979.1 50S ribosomal protein L20 [Candidatus Paceibacterota bacterium]
MTRVKRGKIATKKREKILKQTKGFRGSSKNKERQAKERLLHAYSHQYTGRKTKKREKRRLWQVQLNAYLRNNNITYSKFIYLLKQNSILIDRKILAQLSQEKPEIMKNIISSLKA